MRACAFTTVLDYHTMAEGMKRSFEKFHPDIPLFILDRGRVKEITEDYGVRFDTMFPVCGRLMMDKGFDTVMRIDADIVVTGSLTRALESKADFCGVRANPDQGVAPNFAAFTRPNRITGEYCRTDEELNVGFYCVHNPRFFDDWIKLNAKYAHLVTLGEQDVCNDLLGTKRYTREILDPPGCGEYWGTAANWGESFLESWKGLHLETTTTRSPGNTKHYMEDRVMLRNVHGVSKHVHMLHTAGGAWQGKELGFDSPHVRGILPADVAEFLDTLRT
jgi:hypothetical protein